MNVLFYSDPLARKTPFGTGRYARHLINGLKSNDPEIKVTPWSTWTDCNEAEQAQLKQDFGWKKIPLNRKITGSAWAFAKYPPIELWAGNDHDIVHVGECVYPVRTKKPFVVTIHDIGPLSHPDMFTSVRPWLMEMGLKHAIKEAAAIISVSQSTADIFQDHFKIDLKDRMHVIHEGVNSQYLKAPDYSTLDTISDLPDADTPFLLTMGAISPRKNLNLVIEALEKLADSIPHHLVHVGIPHWDSDEFFTKLKSSPFADRIHLPGYLSDAQVHALYCRAHAYIFPSLFEGFGLPLLEAMAGNCPIITSNMSSMPEIAGDAALLVDPTSLAEVTDAIHAICTDDDLVQKLSTNGAKRIKEFSWEKCAHATRSVYDQVLSK
ncbi:MAG: glycosyltransferase family 4 protein [Opitutaceae bacterium]